MQYLVFYLCLITDRNREYNKGQIVSEVSYKTYASLTDDIEEQYEVVISIIRPPSEISVFLNHVFNE